MITAALKALRFECEIAKVFPPLWGKNLGCVGVLAGRYQQSLSGFCLWGGWEKSSEQLQTGLSEQCLHESPLFNINAQAIF